MTAAGDLGARDGGEEAEGEGADGGDEGRARADGPTPRAHVRGLPRRCARLADEEKSGGVQCPATERVRQSFSGGGGGPAEVTVRFSTLRQNGSARASAAAAVVPRR